MRLEPADPTHKVEEHGDNEIDAASDLLTEVDVAGPFIDLNSCGSMSPTVGS